MRNNEEGKSLLVKTQTRHDKEGDSLLVVSKDKTRQDKTK